MTRILLTGKNGQVGHALQRSLLPFGDVLAVGRNELDLADLQAVQRVLTDYAPHLIVNAAAYTAVDKAETERETAFRINAEAVAVLAGHAAKHGALLVHYSTDYVFDGCKEGAYLESDATAPQSVYGASKLAGEQAIQASGCNALIFRTSWVHSSHGGNFIKTMLRLAQERESLNVVADQTGAPTSAELIADVTALSILAHRLGRLPGGIYHLTADGATSWHGLAVHAVEYARAQGWPLRLDAGEIAPIPSEDYPVPARRPKNSRLDCSKLQRALGLEFPDWRIHVKRTIEQLVLQGMTR